MTSHSPYQTRIQTSDSILQSDLVDVVPMPQSVRAVIDVFVAEHHVERPFHKRERDRADPEALAPHGPMQKERK